MPSHAPDPRRGGARVLDVVEMPTNLIPCTLCTWVVVRTAKDGEPAISRLKHVNALCGCRYAAEAARAERSRISG